MASIIKLIRFLTYPPNWNLPRSQLGGYVDAEKLLPFKYIYLKFHQVLGVSIHRLTSPFIILLSVIFQQRKPPADR